ncbi:hypothetical protein B9Z55_016693 [Caenorhabditis nigoni]|uniref:F-box associated domain-containing protein n=1 Tax=Caenorhabditis nigoni TaxID=1611254 RepID=A0A2G5T5V3_9PELO|nr:hypothetical protein B9Z55_016693 [Caenorhabditis nigoni]
MKCALEPMAVQKALREYINSIFHYSGTYKLILSMKRAGSLPIIPNVEQITIDDITVDPAFLTSLMTTYPDTQSVAVFSSVVGDIPNDSPFFQIPHFYFCGPSLCGPDYIHNFFGRNLYLGKVTCTDQDLIQFLQKWISNEGYHNLETMTITTDYTINQDLIRQAIEHEKYDPNKPGKRPEFLMFDIPYLGSNPTKWRIRSRIAVEIKRIADGKRAFLAMYKCYFNFLVYNT